MIDWLHLVHAPLSSSSSSASVPASPSRDGFYCPSPLGGGGRRRRRRPNKNLADMTSHPATYLLLLVNGVVYLYLNSWLLYILPPPVPSSSVTSSHETVMLSGSFYRIFTSSFSHVAFLHVFFNLSSLHNLRALEAGYGPLKFLDVVGALALGGGLAAPLVSRLQHKVTGGAGGAPFEGSVLSKQPSLGFSGVIFGLAAILTSKMDSFKPFPFFDTLTFRTYRLFGFGLNAGVLAMMAAVHIVVRNASFSGHLGGVIAGVVVGGLERYIVWDMRVLVAVVMAVRLWVKGDKGGGRGEAKETDEASRREMRVLLA
eukprot:CAMPEP_0182456988 /NCGR_PEP_ID=MMETSP1319-20130603/2668_1 /TAXON_ID=172717 /ORGANISM="Bolidomonas pacifica, Strain RCC208" /LENGTH=313 /DNA_ID=CAMNT_0024655359 /DNA_START=130 /DNA_END=1068 /DNA_ORIENTATION=+